MPLPMRCISSVEYRIRGTQSHIWLASISDFWFVFDIPIELITVHPRIAFLFFKTLLNLVLVIVEYSSTLIFAHRSFECSQIIFSNIRCSYSLFGVTFAAYW